MKLQSINRYEAYKDSGIEWIGGVPFHWKNGRIKDFVNTNAATKVPTSLLDDHLIEFIPMSNVDDVLGKIKEFNFVPLKEVSSGYTKFRNGDVIFAKITPCMENGNCAIVSNLANNICYGSTEFMVFRAYRKLSEKYLHYYLHNDLFRRNAEPFMRGTAGQKRISSHYMAIHFFSLPPTKEQQAITTYLDTKTAQIDQKIDLLSQKAMQYGKLKQSLINETVTRGLDKTVPMKDSGVEWIGNVPAHWDLRKLSQSFSQIGSGTTPKSGADIYYEGGTTNWINTGDLNDGILYSCKRTITNKALQDHSLTIYPAGSIIIAMYGATIGKVSISMIDGCTNQACCVLNGSKAINVKFLFYWFVSKREFIISLSYGGGQPNISQETIKSLRIISPSIDEQTTIANYLDEKTAHIDRIVSTINSQIDKLKELRKILINDVVTGKIRVA